MLFLLAVAPLADQFCFHADEHYEFIKAYEVNAGFHLYADIWNDQPPLYTHLLAPLVAYFGNNPYPGRFFSVLFSSALACTFTFLLAQDTGRLPTFLGGLALVTSPYYLLLSCSATVVIPSVLLGLSCIALLRLEAQSRSPVFVSLAGCSLAIGVHIKLTAILFVLPCVFLFILKSEKRRNYSGFGTPFACGFVSAYFMLTALLPLPVPSQWIQSHVLGAGSISSEAQTLLTYCFKHWRLIALALLALACAPHLATTYPAMLLCLMLAVHYAYRPFWDYYMLHVSIPSIWLGMLGLEYTLNARLSKLTAIKVALYIALIASSFVYFAPAEFSRIQYTPSVQAWSIVNALATNRCISRFIYTDRPLFAFYANKLIPPELAVVPQKRIKSGALTPAVMNAILTRWQVNVALIARHGAESLFLDSTTMQRFDTNAFSLYFTSGCINPARL